jgi:hypothetical protein
LRHGAAIGIDGKGMKQRPVVLCILDGWGYREEAANNAVALGSTPVFDHWYATAPRCLLRTDGRAVGLPEGQFGNSEVGHMNLGGGRVMLQELPRIDQAIENGEIAGMAPFQELVERTRASGGRIHLMGCCRRVACIPTSGICSPWRSSWTLPASACVSTPFSMAVTRRLVRPAHPSTACRRSSTLSTTPRSRR